jgi:hypothetical protein
MRLSPLALRATGKDRPSRPGAGRCVAGADLASRDSRVVTGRVVTEILFITGIIAGVGLIVLSGCSSSRDRRLSGFEAQEYKRKQVLTHERELLPAHKHMLLAHPARTEAELDAVLEDYLDAFRARQAADAARAREDAKKDAAKEPGAGDDSDVKGSAPAGSGAAGSGQASAGSSTSRLSTSGRVIAGNQC